MEASSRGAESQALHEQEGPPSHVRAHDECAPSTSGPNQLLELTPDNGGEREQKKEPKGAKRPRWSRILGAFIAVTKVILVAEGVAWAVAVLGSRRRRPDSSYEESDYEPVERLMDYLEGRTDVDSLAGLGTSELLDAAEELDTQDLLDMGYEGTNKKQLMDMMEDLVESMRKVKKEREEADAAAAANETATTRNSSKRPPLSIAAAVEEVAKEPGSSKRQGKQAEGAAPQQDEGASPLQQLSRSNYPWRQRKVGKGGVVGSTDNNAVGSATEAGDRGEAGSVGDATDKDQK